MPIGRFKNFEALKKAKVSGRKNVRDPDGLTAFIADRMQPGWREEASKKAGKTRHLAALSIAAERRAGFRKKGIPQRGMGRGGMMGGGMRHG